MNNVNVDYAVQVNVSGFSLVLLSVFGDGRSINDLLVGGGEWAPPAQLTSWSEQSSPFGGLLGGAGMWGEEVSVGAEWG